MLHLHTKHGPVLLEVRSRNRVDAGRHSARIGSSPRPLRVTAVCINLMQRRRSRWSRTSSATRPSC
jgi:hypothetical protein